MAHSKTLLLSLSAAIPALVAGPIWAAKWDIHPTLSTDATYTDNVALAPAGSEKGAWVTQVTPGISVNATGAQLRLNATYGAQFLNRTENGSGSADRQVNNQFSGSGNAELVKRVLFVDATGSVSQQNVSLLGPQADSNINNTGNRATVRTFSVSPYLRQAFGYSAQGELRLTHSTASTSDTTSLANTQSNGLNMRVSSGPAFKLYTWNVSYSRNSVDSAGQPAVTTETFTAGGRRLITSQVALTSSVGYEKSDYVAIANTPSGAFWNAGVQWTPTPRTNLAATIGHRYFGSTRSLDFSHRSRLTTWSAGYSEDITTTLGQALVPSSVSTAGYLDTLFLSSVPDPVERQKAVQAFIAQNALPPSLSVPLNFLTTQTILTKRWQASVGIQGVRNTVLTNVFRQTSESLAAGVPLSGQGDFASSNTVQQTGGSALWNWRLGTQTAANLSASYTRNEFPGLDRKDDVKSVLLSVNRQFLPRVSGSLNYRSLRNDSSVSDAAYRENAVTAALNLSY